MDWLGCLKAIVSVLPCVDSKVTPHVVYPFKVGSNVKDMKVAIDRLINLKKDVGMEIEDAKRVNGTPTNQIQGWLSRVQTIETESTDIVEKYQQLCRCVSNISPNLCSNYKISKRAAKKRDEAMDLCEEKATIQVIMVLPPQGQEIPASSSKSSYLELVLHNVKADHVNGIIGIWGMGGVGKTHLLEQINNVLCKELSKDLASNVFVVFVTCSKGYYEENAQNTIIEKLGLSKSDNWEVKQLTIYNFLKEKSFVVLLDDLWSSVDLKRIGIPDPMEAVDAYKRKVVLTTRSEMVCRKMGAKKIIKLDGLDWENAWSLFKKNVSEETIGSHPLIEKCARDVVKKLGMGEVFWRNLDPKDVFPRLRVLKFDTIPYLESISWVINLPCIRELYVINCKRMKQLFCIDKLVRIFYGEINVIQHSFPSLKRMQLYELDNLVKISDPMITFPFLEILVICNCKNLKKLPFSTGNPPKSFKYIEGAQKWWDNVEMEDSTHRSSLQPYYKSGI